MSRRQTTAKRDSFAAQLEQDPQLSSSRRQVKAQAFSAQMARSALERRALEAEESKRELEALLKEKDGTIERLESDRRWLAEREAAEREEKEQNRTQWSAEKKEKDGTIRTLRESLSALRDVHVDLEDVYASSTRSADHTIASQNAQLEAMESKLALLEDQLIDLETISQTREQENKELREELEQVAAERDDARRGNVEGEHWSLVRDELGRQAEHFRSVDLMNHKLTTEVTALRERQASAEVLREEKRVLERKLRGSDDLKEKVARLEAEVAAGRKEREEWATRGTGGSGPSSTPVSITQALSSLRLTHATLLEQHGSASAQLRRRDVELKESEQRANETQERVQRLEIDMKKLKDQADRKDRHITLAEREITLLKTLVATFTTEEAAFNSAVYDEQKTLRIHQLEESLKQFKEMNVVLEKEVELLGGDPAEVGRKRMGDDALAVAAEAERQRASLENALDQSRKALIQAQAESEKFQQTIFELRGDVNTGKLVPPGLRVLEMRKNPERDWVDLRQKMMDGLKAENNALLKRVADLESRVGGNGGDGREGGEGFVPRESWEVVISEKAALEEQLAQREKRLLRLQQVFTSKAEEFRHTVSSILGWKIKFYPNRTVKLTSTYDVNSTLTFRPNSSSSTAFTPVNSANGDNTTMQLVIGDGEERSQELQQLVNFWVGEMQSIPCFLGTLTLSYFEQTEKGKQLIVNSQ